MLNRKIDSYTTLIYFLCSLFYILVFRIYLVSHPSEAFIKTIPIWILLIFVCVRHLKHKGGIFLGLGVFFGSLGDYVLSSPQISQNFLIGLSLFFVGHLFYVIAFASMFKYKKSRITISLFVLLTMYGLFHILYPTLKGDLKIPVMAYMAVILLMNITAIFRSSNFPAVILGAIIFMISDSLIALTKFADYNIWDPAIMITYYLAQFLIVFGSVSDAELDTVIRK